MATIIECALNGPWTRKLQPRIPISIDECIRDGVACAKAGASILHVHPYDETGKQHDDWQIYARIIEGIRGQIDVPVYPTIPLGDDGSSASSPSARYAATEALAARGLIELAAVDPGSVNFTPASGSKPFVYVNSDADIRYALGLATFHRFTPCYAIYEPGFLRTGAALHAQTSGAPKPLYRFMFSTEFLFGFPPVEYGLETYLKLLDTFTPGATWMTSGLGVDITGLIPLTVARGGHLRVGLEDAPLGSDTTNVALVAGAVGRVIGAGGSIANVAEMRRIIGKH